MKDCNRNSLNQTIYRALKSIEESSEKYRSLTHKETFLSENLDFQKLSTIVHDFDNQFAKFPSSLQIDYLGNAYQFFLQQFAATKRVVVYYPAYTVFAAVAVQVHRFPIPVFLFCIDRALRAGPFFIRRGYPAVCKIVYTVVLHFCFWR